jgi:ankyrin repeat protein
MDAASLKAVLAQGADINARNHHDGATALIRAASAGYTEGVELLLQRGADVLITDFNGTSALMAATRQGCAAIVDLLLARGADVNRQNARGTTALMIAAQQGHAAIVELLLARDAEVNSRSPFSGTALMVATCHGSAAIVDLLLARGADDLLAEVIGAEIRIVKSAPARAGRRAQDAGEHARVLDQGGRVTRGLDGQHGGHVALGRADHACGHGHHVRRAPAT